jgi:hypothetical protein
MENPRLIAELSSLEERLTNTINTIKTTNNEAPQQQEGDGPLFDLIRDSLKAAQIKFVLLDKKNAGADDYAKVIVGIILSITQKKPNQSDDSWKEELLNL